MKGRARAGLGAGATALALVAACARSAPPPPASTALDELKVERQKLRDRLRDLISDEGALAEAPKGTVVIGVPTSLTRTLVEQTVTGVFDEVTLSLENLRVHKADEVRVKALLGRVTLGSFTLDLRIHEVRALLRPGRPQLEFGGNRIDVALPVTLAEGSGRATMSFRWDGRAIAGAVCGDFDVTHEVKGSVVPRTYPVKGAFLLAAEGNEVVLKPSFGRVRVNVQVEPSRETWQFIDELIAQQGGVCRTALKAIDLREKVRDLLTRGFTITLPRNLFRPLRLPAGLEESVLLAGRTAALEARPIGLAVTPARLWYGADVDVRAVPPK